MINKSIKINHLLISILISTSIVLLYIQFLGNDNTNTIYGDIFHDGSYWEGQFRNYRYVSSSIAFLLYKAGIGYYELIYLWALFFSGALIFACYEFVRYCKLPLETLPFMILAVVANGYMADLYVFSMVFMAYGFAYLGIAISLRASRKYTNYFGIFIGTAAAVLTLLSYQVTGLALLFATSIAIINSTINNHQKNILYFAKPIISFCLGVAVFLALKALLGPSDGRNVSFSYLESNITSYISFSYVMLTQGMGRITPSHEIYIYLGSIILALSLIIVSFFKGEKLFSVLSILAMTASLAIIACPFTLLEPVFWNSPRQMTASVFFFVTICLTVYSKLPKTIRKIAYFCSFLFIAASISHQASYFSFMRGQDEQDALTVKLIEREIRKVVSVTPDTKLAVISTWRNAINHRSERLSAFNAPWSNTEIFRVLTGNFTKVAAPLGACEQPLNDPWRIEIKGEVIVICMD